MKLLQLNVWWGGKIRPNIISLLNQVKPDFICLQEAVSSNRPDPGLFLSIENIQELFEIKNCVFAPMFTFNLMNGEASFGNAIMSRDKILNSRTVYTNLEHKLQFDFNEHDYNVRNFVHATIRTGKGDLNVLTHHGYHIPDHKNGDANTLRQMKQLGKYLDSLTGPIVLTGDFNLAPHSKSLDVINRRLNNLAIEHHLKTTRTILTTKKEVCDYVFVNDQVKVNKFKVSSELVSDHKALVLEFGI